MANGWISPMSGPNVAYRRMSTWLPGRKALDAAEVDREAAFDASGNSAFDGLFLGKAALELDPALFRGGALSRERTASAEGVLDPVEIHIDDVAWLGLVIFECEFPWSGYGLLSLRPISTRTFSFSMRMTVAG